MCINGFDKVKSRCNIFDFCCCVTLNSFLKPYIRILWEICEFCTDLLILFTKFIKKRVTLFWTVILEFHGGFLCISSSKGSEKLKREVLNFTTC